MLGSQALRPIPKNLLRRVCPVLCKCAEFSEYRPQFSLLFYLFASLPFVYFLCSAWTIQFLRDVDVRTPEIAGSWPSSSSSSVTKSQLLLLIFTSRGHRVCCFSSYQSVAMWYRTVQLLMIVFSWTGHNLYGLPTFLCVFDFGQRGRFTVFNVYFSSRLRCAR